MDRVPHKQLATLMMLNMDPPANLARTEMRVMLQEVVGRLGDFEVDGPVHRLRSNVINGIKHLPIAWEAP